MALFDFFKQNELHEIKRLNEEIERIRETSNTRISDLNIQLVRYSALSNIEKEVESKKMELAGIIQDQGDKISEKDAELNALNTFSQRL